MGLCKCPKGRKLTNQFCFVHRVNVCEHCMVTKHPKCVVQSYRKWLRDCDYDHACTLCDGPLDDKDCVRLTCYHVFHWHCLDAYARNLPPTTAPAGYLCPSCPENIFPKPILVSPVADVLREKLAGVNWARAGLGLPLLSDDREQKPVQETIPVPLDTSSYQDHVDPPVTTASIATSRSGSGINSQNSSGIHSENANVQMLGPPYSVVNMESNLATSTPAGRKVFEAYDEPKDITFDHDENKYQRRSPFDMFLRWWKLLMRPPPRRRNTSGSLYKRYAILGAIGVFSFILIIILFSWLGRMATDGDPTHNVMLNPNINVEQEVVEPR